AGEGHVTALVLLSTDCPISNAYVPELNRIAREQAKTGVQLYGILSDPALTLPAALQYRDQHKIEFPLLFDASGTLATALRPTVTPEAFVLDRGGTVLYRGRIDDAYAALGKPRA